MINFAKALEKPSEPRYERTQNGWTFHLGEPRYTVKELGIIYSRTSIEGRITCSKVQHGDFKLVKAYFENHKQILGDLFDLVLINATHADPNDVNFIMDRSAISESHFLKLDAILV